jgi:effector-binding domain-containing protein
MAVRTRTPVSALPDVLSKTYPEREAYLPELNEAPAGPPYTAYFNMDMQDLAVEIGFPVQRALPARGKLQPGNLPAGKAAVCIHTGPSSAMAPAYNALLEHVHQQGHEATGVTYEFYLNDPSQVAPSELQTRIVFPLR